MPMPPKPNFDPIVNPQAAIIFGKTRFSILTERIIRMEYQEDGFFEDQPSQVFWYRNQPAPEFSKTIKDHILTITTNNLVLEYRDSDKGFYKDSLKILLKQNGQTWHFGDKNSRAKNLFGTARTLDGITGRTKLEDGLLAKKGWAVIDDSESLIFNQQGWLEKRKNKALDLYFFGFGSDFHGCLAEFTKIAGAIPMIPRFILGNWWSRYWAYSEQELTALVEEFKMHQVPLSVCIIDMDWHITKTGNESSGWTGYTWNKELFPDPKRFVNWLHEQGLHTALNLHPADGIHPHEAAYPQMANWMGLDPETQQPIPFDIADPHFTEGYFSLLHHPLEKDGVDFWWMDWQQGKKSTLFGLDPLWWLNHLHFFDLGRNNKKPFIFSRWGGLGNHRYPIGFSGDTLITWASLAFQPYFTATAANVGYGWWSHDIGGHMFFDHSPELYTRWVQFGVFSPIFRLHSTNKPHLERRPWQKPEPYAQITMDAMRLRHALIPYLYSMAWRANQTGISLITPMYYEYPQTETAYHLPHQYFFGTELIAAPVTKPVNRFTKKAVQKIWLPPGEWFDFFTGKSYSGNQYHKVTSTIEDIPLFAKAGAIIPLAPQQNWGGINNPEMIDLVIFPGSDNQFDLYEDDGTANGNSAITRFSLKQEKEYLELMIEPVIGQNEFLPSPRTYRIHLRGVDVSVTSSYSGVYQPKTHTLELDCIKLESNEVLKIRFNSNL